MHMDEDINDQKNVKNSNDQQSFDYSEASEQAPDTAINHPSDDDDDDDDEVFIDAKLAMSQSASAMMWHKQTSLLKNDTTNTNESSSNFRESFNRQKLMHKPQFSVDFYPTSLPWAADADSLAVKDSSILENLLKSASLETDSEESLSSNNLVCLKRLKLIRALFEVYIDALDIFPINADISTDSAANHANHKPVLNRSVMHRFLLELKSGQFLLKLVSGPLQQEQSQADNNSQMDSWSTNYWKVLMQLISFEKSTIQETSRWMHSSQTPGQVLKSLIEGFSQRGLALFLGIDGKVNEANSSSDIISYSISEVDSISDLVRQVFFNGHVCNADDENAGSSSSFVVDDIVMNENLWSLLELVYLVQNEGFLDLSSGISSRLSPVLSVKFQQNEIYQLKLYAARLSMTGVISSYRSMQYQIQQTNAQNLNVEKSLSSVFDMISNGFDKLEDRMQQLFVLNNSNISNGSKKDTSLPQSNQQFALDESVTSNSSSVVTGSDAGKISSLNRSGPNKMLQKVLNEFLASERDYCRDLSAVLYGYFVSGLKRLVKQPGSGDQAGLPEHWLVVLFGNLTEVIRVNQQFLSEIQIQISGKQDLNLDEKILCVVDVVNQFARQKFLAVYKRYCHNYKFALDLLKDQMSTNQSEASSFFRQFLMDSMSATETRGMAIESFLIKPVQRICKYPLLLKEMSRYSVAGSEDSSQSHDYQLPPSHVHQSLQDTIQMFDQVVQEINAQDNSALSASPSLFVSNAQIEGGGDKVIGHSKQSPQNPSGTTQSRVSTSSSSANSTLNTSNIEAPVNNKQLLKLIQQQIDASPPLQLHKQENRRLITQGPVDIVVSIGGNSEKSNNATVIKRWLFLFSDLLLVCRKLVPGSPVGLVKNLSSKNSGGVAQNSMQKKFQLNQSIELRRCLAVNERYFMKNRAEEDSSNTDAQENHIANQLEPKTSSYNFCLTMSSDEQLFADRNEHNSFNKSVGDYSRQNLNFSKPQQNDDGFLELELLIKPGSQSSGTNTAENKPISLIFKFESIYEKAIWHYQMEKQISSCINGAIFGQSSTSGAANQSDTNDQTSGINAFSSLSLGRNYLQKKNQQLNSGGNNSLNSNIYVSTSSSSGKSSPSASASSLSHQQQTSWSLAYANPQSSNLSTASNGSGGGLLSGLSSSLRRKSTSSSSTSWQWQGTSQQQHTPLRKRSSIFGKVANVGRRKSQLVQQPLASEQTNEDDAQLSSNPSHDSKHQVENTENNYTISETEEIASDWRKKYRSVSDAGIGSNHSLPVFNVGAADSNERIPEIDFNANNRANSDLGAAEESRKEQEDVITMEVPGFPNWKAIEPRRLPDSGDNNNSSQTDDSSSDDKKDATVPPPDCYSIPQLYYYDTENQISSWYHPAMNVDNFREMDQFPGPDGELMPTEGLSRADIQAMYQQRLDEMIAKDASEGIKDYGGE